MELVKKTKLEGQQKLDEALVEARKRFDREKEEAIKETVRKLQKEFDGRLKEEQQGNKNCLLYTSPSPRDATLSRMPSSA